MKTISWALLLFMTLGWTACKQDHEAKSPGTSARSGARETDPYKLQEARLAWHQKALVEAYQTVGRQRSAWDTPALEALEVFAQLRSGSITATPELSARRNRAITEAVKAGCDDPLIGYLHARFVLTESLDDPVELARRLRDAADALNVSEYNSMAKFYGCLRAASASAVDVGPDNKLPDHLRRMLYATTTNLLGVLRDHTTPVEDIYETTMEWMPMARRSSRQIVEDMRFVEPELKRWGNAPLILLLRGGCASAAGWGARGGGFADSVTPEGWKVFNERQAEAKELVEQAWKQDSTDVRICNTMLELATGLSFSHREMEKWFERAMKLDTNNYTACGLKLHYLKPQWFGSPQEMIAFGRECLGKPWGGNVPLVLVDAHGSLEALLPEAERKGYWKNETVWQDVERGYEKFFALNPDRGEARANLAWHAWQAGKWKTFQDQLSLFRGTNYAMFGGKEEFDRMVMVAREQAKTP